MLGSNDNRGASFSLRTCNFSSLEYSAYINSTCSHNGCYNSYSDFIQVVDLYTGLCLSTRQWNASNTELNFVNCVNDSTDPSQLWFAYQTLHYTLGYVDLLSYGPVSFDSIQPYTQPFLAWYISAKDNKTLEVLQYQYTQYGVLMDLVQSQSYDTTRKGETTLD